MLGAKANRAAKQTSPELIARGFLRFKHNGKPSFMPCLGSTLSIRESRLPVVVNAQADALAAKVQLLSRNLMRVKLAIRRSVSHRNEEKPEISTGHHILTCYLRQSVERRRINVTGLNCTTFLKALYIQQPDLTHLTVSLCGYGFRVLPKKKTRSMAGFVKMGGKRLRQQPLA